MDRHVIANMGAELGATTSVFPSDDEIRRFLKRQKREQDWIELKADADAIYDLQDEIDLSKLEPLIAMPSNPDNVVPVREVAGTEVYQTYIGSSANPGYRDFAIVAEMVRGRTAHPRVSLDVNPSSRQILENLIRDGYIGPLIHAGARLHRRVATDASAWARPRRPIRSAYGQFLEIFRGGRERAKTKCVSSAPKRLRHRR